MENLWPRFPAMLTAELRPIHNEETDRNDLFAKLLWMMYKNLTRLRFRG